MSLVKYALNKKGANIHAFDDIALRTASTKGHLEVVKYLVEHGANIHENDDEAFRYAAKHGHLDVVKYLVEKGVPVERLIAKGYGETKPLAPNISDENRALNRRVEFKIIGFVAGAN